MRFEGALAPFAMLSERRVAAPAPVIANDVIEACRRGDRNALDAVFRAHAGVLERVLARLVGPAADVEDLLQETFAAAITAFPRFRGEASVRSWLHRIAINVAHHHLRRPRHRRELPLVDQEAAIDAPSAVDAMATNEEAARLYRHLEALEARKRIALILYVVEGHSVAEIAALMNATQTATKSRLFWARRALLKSLRAEEHR